MVQLENYLSRICQSNEWNEVIYISSMQDNSSMISYLTKYINLRKIYLVTDGGKSNQDIGGEKVICCTKEAIISKNISVDAVIFDDNQSKTLMQLNNITTDFLIGSLSYEEDYFALWEKYREISSKIYIEYKYQTGKKEILEWEKTDSDIELSIILPVYNIEKYLDKCIETVTKWKVPYIEYLFVNDGSTDSSAQIIQSYAAQDSRIQLINKLNGGCASARNLGITKAKGKYIGFVDADDFIDPQMYYKLLKRAIMGNYEYAYCGYQEYYEDIKESQEITNDCLSEPYLSGTYRADKVQLLTVNTRVAIWRGLYKKSVIDQYGIMFHEDLKRFDDLPFRVEYTFAAKSAVCVPEYMYYYRLGRKGQDTACTDERLYVHFDIFKHLDKYVEKYKDRRLWDLLQVVKIQTHGYGLSKIDNTYKKAYAVKAKEQLKLKAGYWRNFFLIITYAGKSNIGWFTKLWIKN